MRTRVLATIVAGAMLLAAPALPAGAKKKKKKKARPVAVFIDPAGDAGNHYQSQSVEAASTAGFDLVKGIVGQKKKSITFTAVHSAMPDSGSLGEGFRLIWGLVVDGEIYQMTIKSLDVGKPDVIGTVLTQTPQGDERVGQVYEGVARLEQCGTEETPAISFSKCSVLEYHEAVFDPAKKTASWEIPMKAIKAKKGTEIAGGGVLADTDCFVCWVPQYAERSLTPTSIIDAAIPTKIYKVR